jgi:hypothetical protein
MRGAACRLRDKRYSLEYKKKTSVILIGIFLAYKISIEYLDIYLNNV